MHISTVYKNINDLIPYVNNARTHSDAQIDKLASSIREFGFNSPILVNAENTIIAGHARLAAARKAGLTEVPTISLDHLSKTAQKAYILADNRINLDSSWDIDLLKLEFDALREDGFDLELTGFDALEIGLIDEPLMSEGLTDPDNVPDVQPDPVTVLGDIWLLGDHRLMCGDSTMIDQVERLMDGNKADMVFTDPPYGIDYSGRGKRTSNKIANDNIDPTEFYNLMPEISERYIWGRVENYSNLLVKPRDVIIWKKNNFGMGNGYRGQYEVCFYYGSFNGSDSDVWEIAKDTNYSHPTQKPVDLAERAIRNSKPKTVLDLFGGSGSTLIACEKTNRKCFMMEIAPNYCDVIVRRWQEFAGKEAILESTGKSFEDMEHGRTPSV